MSNEPDPLGYDRLITNLRREIDRLETDLNNSLCELGRLQAAIAEINNELGNRP